MFVALVSGGVAPGAEPEPLDAQFLEYLATLEGKEDNWTLVVSDGERKRLDKKHSAPPDDEVKQ